eukprot:6200663-Pleurochrysis_carterae.AAC.3
MYRFAFEPDNLPFALAASKMFETVAARCSFWSACTFYPFALAPHAYLRSARAPLLTLWDAVAQMADTA